MKKNEQSEIYGEFDGKDMKTIDGEKYPVPPNYASKSRLLEGDGLKLYVQDNGDFLYKLVNPIHRRRIIVNIEKDKSGSLILLCDGKEFRVSRATETFFKLKDGDKVMAIIPKFGETGGASIEGIIK